MKQLHIIVSGNVQGVGYRYYAQMKAMQHGIRGWAKNRQDGTVEIAATGPEDQLQVFIEDIRRGNPFSTVDHVDVDEQELTEHYSSFTIKY